MELSASLSVKQFVSHAMNREQMTRLRGAVFELGAQQGHGKHKRDVQKQA
jgi:hypothetical protein